LDEDNGNEGKIFTLEMFLLWIEAGAFFLRIDQLFILPWNINNLFKSSSLILTNPFNFLSKELNLRA